MSTFQDAFEQILGRALQCVKDLKQRNLELGHALQEANKKATSYDASIKTISEVERENRRLAAELETARNLLGSVKVFLTAATNCAETQDVQRLNEELRVVQRIISLYEVLYSSEEDDNQRGTALEEDEDSVSLLDSRDQSPAGLKRDGAALLKLKEEQTTAKDGPGVEAISFEIAPADPGDFPPQAGGIDLVVSPFTHFDTINKFIGGVRALPGVANVTARHFQKGTLRLSVEYEGVIPFVNRLRDLSQFGLDVRSSSPERIEATLETKNGGGRGVLSMG